MRAAFYLENENHKGVDYSNPEAGNPGIGGTQFMFWTIAYYLDKLYKDIETVIYAPYIHTMPKQIVSKLCNSQVEAVQLAKMDCVDFLVLRGPQDNPHLFDEINDTKQKVIFWSHNPENYRYAELASKCDFVCRNICVGKEQLDRLRDHKIFNKSIYIYNALDFASYDRISINTNKKNIVGYMGSLTPKKGFHRLARIWKQVLRQVPDAELYVLGDGGLYGKEWKLGPLNIANDTYEKKIMRYLCDGRGNILPGVYFMGVVSGKKKLELLNEFSVGIANPVGNETFCIVAIEYEYLKIPVVTVKKDGVLDTVLDKKTGLLFRTDKQFVDNIVRLLKDKEKSQQLGNCGHDFVVNNFEIHKICHEWKQLFDDCYNDKKMIISYEAVNWFNNLKWLRELNRNMKKIPLFAWFPSILWYKQVFRDLYKCWRK